DGPFPAQWLALVVSGGHSSLLHVRDIATDVVELGQTLDDAAGEAFDKVGRLLGLPYPGGPHVDKLAQTGDAQAFAFPRGLSRSKDMAAHAYDFSFSGLKTAVARVIEGFEDAGQEVPAADVAASFSEAVADVLVAKTQHAATTRGVDTVVIGGGCSATSRLRAGAPEAATRRGGDTVGSGGGCSANSGRRALAQERLTAAGIAVRIPPSRSCTDSGAMLAALGSAVVAADLRASELDITIDSG